MEQHLEGEAGLHEGAERDVPLQPAVRRGAEQAADRGRGGEQPEADRPGPEVLGGVEHQHRPGGTPRHVEGDDHQHQGPHRRAVPQPAQPLHQVGRHAAAVLAGDAVGGSRTREMSAAAASTHTSWPANGHTTPSANSPAPRGGPARLLTRDEAGEDPGVGDPEVRLLDQHRHDRRRAGVDEDLAGAEAEDRDQHDRRSSRARSPGTSRRTASSPARATLHAAISHRRSTRSATTPAYSPNSSHGSCWSSSAIATRNGSWVWEATSSGPAASRARPPGCSPRTRPQLAELVTQPWRGPRREPHETSRLACRPTRHQGGPGRSGGRPAARAAAYEQRRRQRAQHQPGGRRAGGRHVGQAAVGGARHRSAGGPPSPGTSTL